MSAVTAKALIKAYYKSEITRSYFTGCSRGGGQALMEAQRYPEDFEGINAAQVQQSLNVAEDATFGEALLGKNDELRGTWLGFRQGRRLPLSGNSPGN